MADAAVIEKGAGLFYRAPSAPPWRYVNQSVALMRCAVGGASAAPGRRWASSIAPGLAILIRLD